MYIHHSYVVSEWLFDVNPWLLDLLSEKIWSKCAGWVYIQVGVLATTAKRNVKEKTTNRVDINTSSWWVCSDQTTNEQKDIPSTKLFAHQRDFDHPWHGGMVAVDLSFEVWTQTQRSKIKRFFFFFLVLQGKYSVNYIYILMYTHMYIYTHTYIYIYMK